MDHHGVKKYAQCLVFPQGQQPFEAALVDLAGVEEAKDLSMLTVMFLWYPFVNEHGYEKSNILSMIFLLNRISISTFIYQMVP